MAAVNLKTMDVDALLNLRADIDTQLAQRRAQLQKELGRLESLKGRAANSSNNVSRLKGSKVKPKYRGPDGDTWAGRGAQPRWLTALMKEGRKLDEFLIDQSSGRSRGAGKKARKRKAA